MGSSSDLRNADLPTTNDNPLLLYTSSKDKVREAQEILGIEIRQVGGGHRLSEIQSVSIEEVVIDKAIKAFEMYDSQPILVEHTGLFIDSLNELPGALTDTFLRILGNRKITTLVGKRRRASAKTCVGFYNGHHVFYWTGKTTGRIAERPRGVGGFGWDSIFIPSGRANRHGKTFAQMTREEKNSFSMRKRALLKLRDAFSEETGMSLQELVAATQSTSTRFYIRVMKEGGNKRLLFEPIHQSLRSNLFEGMSELGSVPLLQETFNLEEPHLLRRMGLCAVPTPSTDEPTAKNAHLGGSVFLRLQFKPQAKLVDGLRQYLGRFRADIYSTYGDAILKRLRDYLIQSMGVEKEDAFFIYRASNARFYDEILRMRTASGEALYYNPNDMISPIKYLRNAFEKNRRDRTTNSLFRAYVMPEVASIWVYSNKAIKAFAKTRGGYFYVPVISLAEVAAHFVRREHEAGRLQRFVAHYTDRYTEEDIVDNWAYRAFDMFPAKELQARLHVDLAKRMLSRYGMSELSALLDAPNSLREVCTALRGYRDLLMKKCVEPLSFLAECQEQLPDHNVQFVELVVLDPGMKSREHSIPNTPDAEVVFLQGEIDYPFMREEGVNQLVTAHNITRAVAPADTRIVSLLDHRHRPIADVTTGHATTDSRLSADAVMLEFLSLLILADVSTQAKVDLVRTWCECAT